MTLLRRLASVALAGLLPASLHAGPAAPLYQNDFETAGAGQLPAELMVMAGEFSIVESDGGKALELPGEPLDTFGLLFGPGVQSDVTASARFFGTRAGRKFPTFGISLNGIGGYRLQVSPAKKALEFCRGDEPKSSVPFAWSSDSWTALRIQIRKDGEGWIVEGKAWPAEKPEPAEWTITLTETKEPAKGRAGIWGSPYAGTPIRFDDLLVAPAK